MINEDNEEIKEVPREPLEVPATEENLESEAWPESPSRGHRSVSFGRTPYQLWLVSYSDFMTILTIFFLAMYGYTYLDAASILVPKPENISYSAFSQMVQQLQGQLGDQIKVENQLDKVTIELGEKILFPSGSAKLSDRADAALSDIAASLKRVEGNIIVQGHTDNVPVASGRFKSNWELSAARAFSVIEYLTEKGVPADRLAAWGFGEHHPQGSNETVEGRAGNRRIEIVVLKTKKAA